MDLLPISIGLLLNIVALTFICGVGVGMLVDYYLGRRLDK